VLKLLKTILNKLTKWFFLMWESVNCREWCNTAARFLIPILICIFALCQNDASNELQKDIEERTYELKLVELAWNDIISEDDNRINRALNFINTFQPNTSRKLALAVFQDTTQTIKTREKAKIIFQKSGSHETEFGPGGSGTGAAIAPGKPEYLAHLKDSIIFKFDNNDNSHFVEYAIIAMEEKTDLGYINKNGYLSKKEIWQTHSQWGNVMASGLKSNKKYTFKVKAKNQVDVETAFSESSEPMTTQP